SAFERCQARRRSHHRATSKPFCDCKDVPGERQPRVRRKAIHTLREGRGDTGGDRQRKKAKADGGTRRSIQPCSTAHAAAHRKRLFGRAARAHGKLLLLRSLGYSLRAVVS